VIIELGQSISIEDQMSVFCNKTFELQILKITISTTEQARFFRSECIFHEISLPKFALLNETRALVWRTGDYSHVHYSSRRLSFRWIATKIK
jgi:hypothetical protein